MSGWKKGYWLEDEVNYLINNYDNQTQLEIAKKLGRTKGSVMRKVKSLGLTKRRELKLPQTRAGFYFLGLLSSDGYVSSSTYEVRIALKQDDKEILYKLKDCLNFGNIYEYHYDGRTSTAMLSIVNKYFHNSILKLGIHPNKSRTLKFPGIPEKYIQDYIRGVFDGDGSFYYHSRNKAYHSSICSGSKPFMDELHSIIKKKANLNGGCYYENRGYYYFRMSKRDTIKFGDWLYSSSPIHLERKYNIYFQNISNA